MPIATLHRLPWHLLGDAPWPPVRLECGLRLPARADVAIVGAGVTGLSAAIALAASGARVVVIDRAIGQGAAARSGGLIVGNTLIGPAPGFDRCEASLRAWVESQACACDLRWTGCWELERDHRLAPAPIDWHDGGAVRVARTVEGGTLDPSAFLTCLAHAALAAGAIVVDGVEVTSYAATDRAIALTTSAGGVIADRALVAVDAAARPTSRDPWPTRAFTIALETEVVDDGTAGWVGWSKRLPFYTNELPLLWGRATPEGRLIAGRELVPANYADEPALTRALAAAGDRLVARLRALHPGFASLGIRRIWAGPIARDARGVPAFVEDSTVRGVLWAGGYGGHGLAQAFRLGQLAATRLR